MVVGPSISYIPVPRSHPFQNDEEMTTKTLQRHRGDSAQTAGKLSGCEGWIGLRDQRLRYYRIVVGRPIRYMWRIGTRETDDPKA